MLLRTPADYHSAFTMSMQQLHHCNTPAQAGHLWTVVVVAVTG